VEGSCEHGNSLWVTCNGGISWVSEQTPHKELGSYVTCHAPPCIHFQILTPSMYMPNAFCVCMSFVHT
jgi:hypothetical protein